MAMQPAYREYRTWVIDSRRWNRYHPRPDNIVISAYPKCGTTWTQRIVQMLIFASPEPVSLSEVSPWIDRRTGEPIERLMERVEAQTHRRMLKAHLPFDGLPIYDEVKYVHVARDGRDASLSFHNHALNFSAEAIWQMDEAGFADETIARSYPSPLDDPAEHFHRWITEGGISGDSDGTPAMSYFHFERSWWDARDRANVLLVHFADLKANLAGEMQRLADFLGIEIEAGAWLSLVEAAGFKSMGRDADKVLGNTVRVFRDGAPSFFDKGENERWRGLLREEDLALYDAKAARELSPECSVWLSEVASRPCAHKPHERSVRSHAALG